jgi:hypothetical protein
MSTTDLSLKEKFLSGQAFVGKQSYLHKYRYDDECGVQKQVFGVLPDGWAYYALVDKINEAGCTLYISALGAKTVTVRIKFEDLIFIPTA